MPKPVLMTVDDDPGVSRSVARDPRRRYGQDHRIVRAESGVAALEALRELVLRGEPVAAILADYRMPNMNGIEFLEQAMDIAPHARRALLTAYADTDAAIQAINVVDIDHYLLKPWDPPEEKLYPVVDSLLEAWQASPEAATTEVRVIGHRWSARSYGIRDFLARNLVPYRWLLADDPEGARLLSAAGVTADQLPVVITPEGKVLVQPDNAELAAQVGLATQPAADFYDLVVVGAGPAGLGAAVYGASEGLRTVLVEARALDRRGHRHVLSREDMRFSYRHCGAPEDLIFVEALFEGWPGDPAEILARMNEITEARAATQPVNTRTGGSTFKNPDGAKAWQLVDAAGCRGLRIGQAQVSEMHCNFLVNLGGATAAEIENLGEEVRRRVKEHSGVTLAWEIKRVGVA